MEKDFCHDKDLDIVKRKISKIDDINRLLESNKHWAAVKVSNDPDYFTRLVHIQTPKYLWIGCSDSRVPPDSITQTQPGEIFIHRNVANLVVHTDMNLLSVLQYAIFVLKVEHVIICGHYNCGGVKAALGNISMGFIDNWLRHIKDVYRFNKEELEEIKDEKEKLNRLTELNVIEQVKNLSRTNFIQKSWEEHKFPTIHGWIYDLHDGIIKQLIEKDFSSCISDEVYKYDNPVNY